MFALLVAVLIIATKDCTSLKLRDFSVPPVVMRGDPVWLNCSYDLERDKLYSIKWHKNNVEFYRYLPADNPPGQKYELPGIYLELSRSREGHVFMSRTDIYSEGTYRCEVSTEAPYFRTVKGEREMRVYVNPRSPPVIQNVKQQYYNGEIVNVTCVSAPSRPAAALKWWINDREVESDSFLRPKPKESPDGLYTTSSTLRFKARPGHFRNGRMTLICEAVISQAHTLRSEEILISNNSTFPQRTVYSDYGVQKDGPNISGGKNKYSVGDLVDINCTSSKSQPPAELHWYINDREVKPDHLLIHDPILYRDGTASTVLGLRFVVKHRHFQKNEMRLRCTATLSKVKTLTSEPLEVEFSERQISDLHVDFKAGAVSSKSFQEHESYSRLWIALLLNLIIRYIF